MGDRYIDIFQGRAPRTTIAKHYTSHGIERLKTIYDARAAPDTKFVCSNVYDLRDNLEGEFDIVFTSIGVLNWLKDIEEWGKIVAHFLKSGGTFLLYESHPFMWVLDDKEGMKIKYSYWHTEEPIVWEADGTYANLEAKVTNKKSYEWQHSILSKKKSPSNNQQVPARSHKLINRIRIIQKTSIERRKLN